MERDGSSRGAAMRRLLSKPPFRLFWIAAAASSFGDQFSAIALPWLVLQLSRSDMALGSVLMTAALPRVALLLAGGALSDRVPPARLLRRASIARAILVGALAALVAAPLVHLWQLYPFAFAFGALDALSGPASAAIVPRIAGDEGLAAANGVVQSTAQVSALVAPTPAGELISSVGIGASFAVSAVASALACVAYALIPRAIRGASTGDAAAAHRHAPEAAIPASTMEVLRACLRDPALRAYLVLIAALSLATSGPIAVGIPSLARVRFGGSVSLGVMLSACGGGTLMGTLLAGSRRSMHHRGALVLGVNALIGVLLILLGYAPTVASASLVIGIMACGSSFVNLMAMTTLQAEANHAILGRLMSVVMFASVGLSPVSYALAGLASAVDPVLLFGAAGVIVMGATAQAAFSAALRRVD